MNHQDWTPLVIKKNVNKMTTEDKVKKGYTETIAKKTDNKQSQTDVNMKKLEEDEDYKVPTISYNLSSVIQKARFTKNLTQKQLAVMCNIQVSVVQNYENPNSKVPIESSVLQKLSKALGVQLKKPK
jgi:ribosome-binding protein aMBF1 (putative translation factor)